MPSVLAFLAEVRVEGRKAGRRLPIALTGGGPTLWGSRIAFCAKWPAIRVFSHRPLLGELGLHWRIRQRELVISCEPRSVRGHRTAVAGRTSSGSDLGLD